MAIDTSNPTRSSAYSRKPPSISIESLAGLVREFVLTHGSRVTRFGLVGLLGTAVNMGVLFVLVHSFGINHVIGAAVGAEVSIVGNFVLNDRWTFQDARSSDRWFGRLARYNTVALGGTIISLGVLAMLTTFLGFHYLIANLFAIGVATVANYALNSRFTWSLPGREPELVPIPVPVD